jgi:hypothetical protein
MSLYFYILTQERNRLKHSKEMEINMTIATKNTEEIIKRKKIDLRICLTREEVVGAVNLGGGDVLLMVKNPYSGEIINLRRERDDIILKELGSTWRSELCIENIVMENIWEGIAEMGMGV